MKKTAFLLIVLLSISSLTSCDPGWNELSRYIKADDVAEISIINYDNPDVKWLSGMGLFDLYNTGKGMKDFDFDAVTVIEILPTEFYEEFVDELTTYVVGLHWSYYDSPNGLCMRILFKNGEFFITTLEDTTFSGKYYMDGSISELIGTGIASRGRELCNQYFDYQFDLPADYN